MFRSRKLLLVEGKNDQSFFEQFCTAHALDPQIVVAPPVELQGTHNTKQGAINHLKHFLLQQLADGALTHIGVVLDADQTEHGGGFARTIAQVAAILPEADFESTPQTAGGGLIFPGKGGPGLGLWVMPNNYDDGILEDWIAQSITSSDQVALFDHASQTVTALPDKKFKAVQQTKADVATWLAWQAQPGAGLYYALAGEVLDPAAPLYTGFHAWITRVFD